jgi:class 3 adenylate cyclase/tetratricopeptide (TPR) repeat protein
MREEHRTITVLFADLAGSTALAERLHDEEVKLVVGEAIGRVVTEIERLGGYVKDLAGDGVLAFFGAPVSHEDDAERAARAALSILASIGAYSADVARGWGVEQLAVRIGISTGPVALGPIVAGRRVEYAAFGDTVNTAARLQSAADVDTIFVDSATHRAIEPLFDWTGPHVLHLKGKSAPTDAFGLRGTVSAPSRHRWAGGRLTTIIGRDDEMAMMQRAVDDVRAGRGGIVSITGQAGVGKSRLLADTQDRSDGGGEAGTAILWLEGRCASYAEGVPYFPVRDLLHDWLGVSDGDPEVRVRIALRRALDGLFRESAVDVYPYLAALLGLASDEKPAGGAEFGAEELQQRTFAAISMLIDRLAQDTPIVVAFEDLHWADATSIKLVLALLPVVERSAVLLLMTHRDDRDHAAWGLKETAARDYPHLNHDVALDSLPAEAERLLLHELVGVGTLSADLEHRVLDAADGNPLFLEELVRSLVDTGALVEGDQSHWRLDRDVPIVIPETVERVILARADRLPPNHRQVLTAASVAGRRFDLSLLADLAGPQGTLLEALHNLQRLGFVVQERRWPEPEYRFKHVLIQEAIYRTMLSDERTRLHQAAAESLERGTRATQDDVLALARHWRAAGHHGRATPYYRKGAELAIRAFANEEAAEALTHALDLLREEPESRPRDQLELELRIALGVPLVARGGWGTAEVRDDYARARDLCIRLGQPVSPPILRGLAINSVIRLELDQAMEYGTALLEVAQRTDDQLLTVEANYALGVTTFWEGDFMASRGYLEEAIARYSSDHHERHIALYSQDPKVVCLCRLGLTRWYLGYPQLAASARDEAITLAEELGHPFSLGHAYAFGAVISHELQDDRRSDELVAALESLATNMGLNFWVMFSSVYKHSAAAQTDPAAIEPMKAAMTKLSETGQTLWGTFFLALVARAQLLSGDSSSGLESIEEALRQTHATGARYVESELHRLRGELLHADGASAGDVDAAFRLAHAIAVRQQAKALELRAALALMNWWVASGSDSEKMEGLRMLETAYGWFAEHDDTPDLTAARKLLGDLG